VILGFGAFEQEVEVLGVAVTPTVKSQPRNNRERAAGIYCTGRRMMYAR